MENQIETKSLSDKEITDLADNIVLGGISQGASLRQIETTVAKRPYNQADKKKLLDKVRDLLEDAATLDPMIIKGTCIIGMQNLYKKLYETGDYSNAIKALERLFKMTNTEVNEKIYPEEEEHDDGTEE